MLLGKAKSCSRSSYFTWWGHVCMRIDPHATINTVQICTRLNGAAFHVLFDSSLKSCVYSVTKCFSCFIEGRKTHNALYMPTSSFSCCSCVSYMMLCNNISSEWACRFTCIALNVEKTRQESSMIHSVTPTVLKFLLLHLHEHLYEGRQESAMIHSASTTEHQSEVLIFKRWDGQYVINDPLGHSHSHTISEIHSHLI